MHQRGGTGRNRLRLLSLLLVLLVGSQLTGQFSITPSDQDDTATSGLQAKYAQLPLAFEPNHGQVDDAVQYLVHHGQATTYFTGTDTVTSIGDEYITMSLNGANQPLFTGTDQLESKTNYFIGNDQSKWQSNVPNYQSILAKNVYPGIDLKYYGTNSQLEHDFIVSPGTDPKQIAFNFSGQENLSLDKNGNLVLRLADTEAILHAPVSYQDTPAGRQAVASSFTLSPNNTVSIALSDYDPTETLVIDPTLSLIYSTYLGGTGDETGYGVSVDINGSAYVTGTTTSTDFPTSAPYQAANAGGATDIFVTKLNATGSALVYSTYLGGTGDDISQRVVVDTSGNAYIAGETTSTDFPTSAPYQASFAGGTTDAIVVKLNTSGSVLSYATYLGGTANDYGYDIVIDDSGNAYVAGNTGSTDFPTVSPYQGSHAGQWDVFVSKFDSAGTALTYSTYLGGALDDSGTRIAISSTSAMYITGFTSSTDFPTSSPFQGSFAGGTYDAFVANLSSDGSTLTYATYLGGTGVDTGEDITVDASDNAYIGGATDSTDYPTSVPYQASNAGLSDLFVTKLDSAGATLTYSTYLGGTGNDIGPLGLATDGSGNTYIGGGNVNSTDFPTNLPYQTTFGGANDAIVAKLNSSGSALTYSTYLGGAGTDRGFDIALGLNGNAYVVGWTDATDFPTSAPFQGSNAGASDVFITQITESTVNLQATVDAYLNFTLSTTVCDMGHFSTTQTKFCTHTMSAATNAAGGYTISYIPTVTLTSGANTIDEMSSQTSSVLASEQFGFNLMANTSGGSNTAANFGADPTGGSGYVLTGYELADQFQFLTGGDSIAESTTPSLSTLFTASYMANITLVTEPGTYATPVTYNIVGSF